MPRDESDGLSPACREVHRLGHCSGPRRSSSVWTRWVVWVLNMVVVDLDGVVACEVIAEVEGGAIVFKYIVVARVQ